MASLSLSSGNLAHAQEASFSAPVAVEHYKPRSAPVVEVQESSLEELWAETHPGQPLPRPDLESGRTEYRPDLWVGKYIARIHKSHNPKVPEYLEILRQESADASDVSEVNIFNLYNKKGELIKARGTNHVLVSTAGVHYDKKKGKKRQYLTPEGVFSVDWQEKMHYSKAYGNAPMPWSTFFAWDGAVAIHGATPNEFDDLGRNASHGCVRVHPTNAKSFFDFVQSVGKQNVIIQVLPSA